MTPEQIKAVHDQIAAIVAGIINGQREVQPQVLLMYLGPTRAGIAIPAIPLPHDIVMEGVSSAKGKQVMAQLIGGLLRGDHKLPTGAPDAIVQVFEGWSLIGISQDAYDPERDGPIADMPNRVECAFIALHTLQGSTGGVVRIETDADGQRRAVPVPFSGEVTLTGRMVPEPPEMQ